MARTTKGSTLWLALWRTSRDVQRLAEADIAASGLCLTDFAVLEALLHGGPQRVSAIAHKVMLTSGSMTTAVDRLVERGLVARDTDATDARARVVRLTAEGRALIEPAFVAHATYLDEVFSALDEAERAQMLELLLKLRGSTRERS